MKRTIHDARRRFGTTAVCCALALLFTTGAASAGLAAPAPAPPQAPTEQMDPNGDYSARGLAAPPFTASARAVPETPEFGPEIDGYAANDAQDTCDPDPKPGTVALRSILNDAYGDHTGYIGRACDQGGTSEHKEGRALDYMLNVDDRDDRDVANSFLGWLLDTDQYGNKHAMARRLGVMYIIWNHRIWSAARASDGWREYGGANPHTDHIHISQSWAGARKQTTWWTAARPAKTYDSVNGDARADLVVHEGSTVNARMNDGSGFDGGKSVTSGWGLFHGMQVKDGLGRLYFADYNGDHRTDLIVHEGSDIQIRLNTGNGFDGGKVVTSGWGMFHGRENGGLGRLYFADYNRDNRADMIVHENSDIQVRLNTGNGFDGGKVVTSGWGLFHGKQVKDGLGRLYFADHNGDDRADMIVHEGSDIQVRLNTGNGFDGGKVVTSGWGMFHGKGNGGLGRLYFADHNGDNRADMIVHENSDIQVRLNTGNGFDGGKVVTSGWGMFHGKENGGLGRLYLAS
jgi:hypothetical protein